MPVVRAIRSRGVTGWVEVHGEVLFAHTGDVAQWSRAFSRKVSRFTSAAAPVNKRPRWAHYGKPLKQTITASTKASPATLKVHSAIGSTASHAYYVDQGTGVYGGNGPYEAKILPPYTWQSPSLYEHTFRVPVNNGPQGEPNISWEPIGKIMIKGQKGQRFFDKGLERAFGTEGMLTVQAPGTPPGMIGFPEQLANFVGNTEPTAAFRSQLEEWRSWRDRAWAQRRILGQGYVSERFRREFRDVRKSIDKSLRSSQRAEARRKASMLRSRRWREEQRRKNLDRGKPTRAAGLTNTQKADRERFLAAMSKKYDGRVERHSIHRETIRGVVYWVVTVGVLNDRGRVEFIEVRAKAKS